MKSNMIGINSSPFNSSMSAHGNKSVRSETHILTPEEVNEQIKNYIAPFTRQVEDLIKLTQG